MIEGINSYKDLLELIDINENILNNCKQSHRQIEMYLLKQGRPAGYREATSYIDADCIKGSRPELHADSLQKLIDEMSKLESMIFLQEEILKGLYNTKKEIDSKLKKLEGLEYKVYYMNEVEGKTLREVAATLGYSEEHIRRVHSKTK
jgi:DNA-directed RNA polymerase specialized sigma subunit